MHDDQRKTAEKMLGYQDEIPESLEAFISPQAAIE